MNKLRKGILACAISIVLCITLFAGSTYAWFTDSVSSGTNTIVAGNLDIDAEFSKDMINWTNVEGSTDFFSDVTLWEPGACSVLYLKLNNRGTLGCNYSIQISVVDKVLGTNTDNQSFQLTDYIMMGYFDEINNAFTSRVDAISGVNNIKKISAGYNSSGVMQGLYSKVIAFVIYMPTDTGNVCNPKTGTQAPKIECKLQIVASQYANEEDSFGSDYDLNAEAPELAVPVIPVEYDHVNHVATINNSNGYIQYMNGEYVSYAVKLGGDIDFGGETITKLTITSLDGDGHTIKNAKAKNYLFTGYNEGILGTVKNLTIENVEITTDSTNIDTLAIGIFGSDTITRGAEFVDLTVKGCTITGGAYAGAIVGNVSNSKFTNCKAVDCVVTSAKTAGALFGFIQTSGYDVNITGCSAASCTVNATVSNRTSVGTLIGRCTTPDGGDVVISGCSATETVVKVGGETVSRGIVGDTAGYAGVTINGTEYKK